MAIPPLGAGQYYYDGEGALYFSEADGNAGTGTTPIQVTHSYSFFPQYLTATEIYLLESGGLTITVEHSGYQKLPDGSESVIFAGGTQYAGYVPKVFYYPAGTPLAGTNSASAPTATGTFTWQNSSGQGIFQFYSGDVGQTVCIVYPYLNSDYDSTAVSLAGGGGLQIDFLQGTSGQAPPTSISGGHPDQFGNGQLGYTDTACAYQYKGYLGSSGTLPDYSYEVIGSDIVGAGTLDADPVLAIQTLLTDSKIGINFPSTAIDNASWFSNSSSASNWVNANKFYVSQAITNPTSLSSIIGRWLEAFNVAAVWSEGLIKLIPYGDQNVSSSSPVAATYVPNLTIAANLTDDDFIVPEVKDGSAQDPVKVTRSPWADAFNRVQIGYRNREAAYNPDLVFEEDQGAVERFGLRIEGQQSLDFVSTWQLASAVANMRLKRLQTVRNHYTFSLPVTYEWLEPMDLVSLTDSRLGLEAQTVRITKIANDPVKGLAIEAEDFPGNGYAMPVANTKAATPALHPTIGSSLAGASQVVIVQATDYSASSQTPSRLYIWVKGKDSNTWGSADIYRSLDGSNWEQMAVAVSAAPIFALTAALPSVAANPQGALGLTHDSTSTLMIQPATSGNIQPVSTGIAPYSIDQTYAAGDLATYDGSTWVAQSSSTANVPTDSDNHWLRLVPVTANAGSPPAVTDAAASNLQNLSAIVGTSTLEFLSYANVAAGTLVNTFALTDLYRGALGTTPQAAPLGSVMVQFDAASATWDIPAGLSGQTVYFRVVARNVRGHSRQALDTTETIEFVIQAPGSDAAWDSLGGIIGDVIGNSGGSGEIKTTAKIDDTNATTIGNVAIGAVTGTQQNLVPDSDLKYPSQYWPTGNGISIGYGGGFGSGLTLVLDCNANVTKPCPTYFPVTPNQPITISANMAANSMTAGYALVGLDWVGRSVVWEVTMNAGTPEARLHATFTVPAGVYEMRVYYGQWNLSGSPAGTAYINQIQVEVGSAMTAYKSNALDMLTGGLPSGISVFDPNGTASTVGNTTLGAVTGTQRNLLADPAIKLGALGGNPYWSGLGDTPASPTVVFRYGPTGSNAFQIFQPASAWGANGYIGVQAACQVVANQEYTASAFIDAADAGACMQVNWPGGSNTVVQSAGGKGRVQMQFTPNAAGQATLYLLWRENEGAPAAGRSANFAAPQIEAGGAMTAYRESLLDDTTGGLPANLQVQEPGGALSPVVLGDAHKRSRTGFDVNGYLLTGTVATPVASLDTGASRANTAIDSGNILVAGSADFARAYLNKHLGNMPDDPVSGRLARRSAYIGVGGTATWINLGTWTFPADGGGYALNVTGLGGQGFNSGSNQQAKIEILVRSGDGGVDNIAPNISGCTWIGHGNSAFVSAVKVISHGGSTAPQQNQWDVLVDVNVWSSAHWDFYCDPKSSFATSGATTTDPGAASTTVVVGAGQYVHDTSANLYGALLINGTTKSSIGLHDLHDRVAATVSGYGGTGCDNIPFGTTYGHAAMTQLDSNGNVVVLGTAGTGVKLNVGNGSLTPSTGGRQVKRFWITQPTAGGYSDGQVFYFRSADGTPYLLDQGGSPLTAPDNAPYVALIAYGMASPPQSFYAAGVTNKQFTMHAVNGTTSTSASTALSSGVNSTYTVPAGDTAKTVNLSCVVDTTSDLITDTPRYQNQTINFSYTITANGGTVTAGTGSVPVVWNSDGSEYTGSATISCSVPAADVITVNVTWGSHIDATPSASYTVTTTAATGATGVNFIAMISESW